MSREALKAALAASGHYDADRARLKQPAAQAEPTDVAVDGTVRA